MAQEEPVLTVLAGEQYYILLNRHNNGPNSGGGFKLYITGIGSDTTCFTTGLANEMDISNINAPYPIPADDAVTLSLPGLNPGQASSITIYNTTGALVKQVTGINQPQITIDINDLPAGLYYYRVDTRLGIKTDKFIKQ